MSIEYGLVFNFFRRNSIFHIRFFFVQVTLSHFSKFKIIVGMSLLVFADTFFVSKKQKRFIIAKLLRIYYVRGLSVSYRMNVRTSQKMVGVHR